MHCLVGKAYAYSLDIHFIDYRIMAIAISVFVILHVSLASGGNLHYKKKLCYVLAHSSTNTSDCKDSALV